MVAHPDDCVIFAYSFMHHYQELDWTVCYLTRTDQDPRGKELAKFWDSRGVATQFLGFTDSWEFVKNGNLGFDAVEAQVAIQQAIQGQDLILTHSHKGDYGHLHHKFVSDVVCNQHHHVVTFAGVNQGNVKYTIDSDVYSLDELPLHREVIAGFHQSTHTNEYAVSDRVRKIL